MFNRNEMPLFGSKIKEKNTNIVIYLFFQNKRHSVDPK